MLIKELKKLEQGAEFNGCLRVKTVKLKETSSGKPYYDLQMNDKMDVINAKIWDVPTERLGHEIKEGDIIKFKGILDNFNDMPQIRINPTVWHIVNPSEADYQECLKELIPVSCIDSKTNQKIINTIFDLIKDEEIRKVTQQLLVDNPDFSRICAGATYHDIGMHGLLEHTAMVATYANFYYLALQPYLKVYGLNINHSILTAAALLHDIAKVQEYLTDETGISTGFSKMGILEGHIVGGVEEINKTCLKLGIDAYSEKFMILKHTILAHHGAPEYGSPKVPLCLEALLLHHADLTASKQKNMLENLSLIEEGEFTERLFKTDRNQYYLPINEEISSVTAEDVLKNFNKVLDILHNN